MANTKQLSRPEMLPEPFEKQAPEQDFWMKPNAHLFDLKLSKKRTKKKGSPLKINIPLCVLKEVTE